MSAKYTRDNAIVKLLDFDEDWFIKEWKTCTFCEGVVDDHLTWSKHCNGKCCEQVFHL